MVDQADVLHQLHPGLQSWVREAGWSGLSDIQRAAIPRVLAGGDCLIEAPTAGGKTEAVLFPVLTRVAPAEEPGVRVLYLAPLRALLNDLELRVQAYCGACGVHAFKWHGDVSQKEKVDQIRTPPYLLLTTPESIEAILLRKAGWQKFLGPLEAVIVDEAHSFALGERGHHLVSLLSRIEEGTGRRPQLLALTATVGNPESMAVWLAGNRGGKMERLHVTGSPPERDFEVRLFADSTADEGEQEPANLRRFRSLAGDLRGKRSIVFVQSRRSAENLAKSFAAVGKGPGAIRVRTHHSAVSKYFREEAEARIRQRSETGIDAIISTSTLELGIDIGALDQVVQLDALSSSSAFLQRVGRTGRRLGRKQRFRGLCTEVEDALLLAATTSLGMEGRAEAIRFPTRAFHILAHQTLCLSLQRNGVSAESAWAVLSGAHCFSGIEAGEYDRLVEHMVADDYLRRDGELLLTGEKTERRFLGAGWRRLFAVFDAAPLYDVFQGTSHVGTLDAGFVEGLATPFNFVLAGRHWAAQSVEPKRRVVKAKPASQGDAPKWSSFGGIDVPPETARRAGELLAGDELPAFLGADARSGISALREVLSLGWDPGEIRLLASASTMQIVTFAGDKVNRALSALLQARGLGGVTSNFRSVTVRLGKARLEEDSQGVLDLVTSLAQGPRLTSASLAKQLEPVMRRFPFSPFAACLPDDLLIAALVDQRMDPEGLQRTFTEAPLRLPVGRGAAR